MRRRVTEEQIRLAKAVDLITYMKQYEPQELIRTGPHDYKTATHSSLCISDNGLWHWFSHDIGGRGALNYLIQVKGMDFTTKPFSMLWGLVTTPGVTSGRFLILRRIASEPTAFSTVGRPAAVSALPVWHSTSGMDGTAMGEPLRMICSIVNLPRT